MSDLIERARKVEDDDTYCGVDAGRTGTCHASYLISELADEIERLTTESSDRLDELEIWKGRAEVWKTPPVLRLLKAHVKIGLWPPTRTR